MVKKILIIGCLLLLAGCATSEVVEEPAYSLDAETGDDIIRMIDSADYPEVPEEYKDLSVCGDYDEAETLNKGEDSFWMCRALTDGSCYYERQYTTGKLVECSNLKSSVGNGMCNDFAVDQYDSDGVLSIDSGPGEIFSSANCVQVTPEFFDSRVQ